MNDPTPPKLPLHLLRWFCQPDLLEDVEGDLNELFERAVEKKGMRKAKWTYIWEVLKLFRSGIIKPSEGTYRLNHYGMFKNYFKVSVRNLVRNKTYTTINLLGLVMSLGIAMALYWIVQFEWSFDNYHNEDDKLYQIIGVKEGGNGSQVPFGAILALREKFPKVERAVSVHRLDPSVIQVDEKNLKQENVYFVHPEVFDILKIKWIAGSPESSFNKPHEVVLDQPTALRLFGNEDPLGKIIHYDNSFNATVSGIIEQVPVNSDFQFQMIFAMDSHPWEPKENHWGGGDSSFKGLALLKDKQDKEEVEDRLTKMGQEYDVFYYDRFEFRPLNSIHLDPDNDPFNYYTPGWLLEWLLYIGLFLVLIACMNFINLATVQLELRNKEIAVRKLLGSSRTLLMLQFLTETAIMVLIAVALSIGLSNVIINYANQLLNTNIDGVSFWRPESVGFILLVTLGVTLVAGLYPALTISGFQPIRFFQKKTQRLFFSKVSSRQVLIVLQFVIAQIMVVAIITGKKQVEYFKSKDLGFDQSGVVLVNMPDKGDQVKRERFANNLINTHRLKVSLLG
jgi:putative ABC transport system permease protein